MQKLILIFICLAFTSATAQPPTMTFHSDFEKHAFQTSDPMQIMLASDPQVDFTKYKEYRSQISQLTTRLEKKNERADLPNSLKNTFYVTHRKQLNWYQQYVPFSEIFSSGKYDCVTGTALFAMLLDSINVPYSIYEFDYHIFIIAQIGSDSVLLESTDPYYGYVTDRDDILERISFYQQEAAKEYGSYITNIVGLKELAGLQYMNMSIKSFNDGQMTAALDFIQKAKFLYPSSRIKQLHEVFSRQMQLVSMN